MRALKEKAVASAAFLASRMKQRPQIAYLTGTGLGNSAGFLDSPQTLNYSEIPYFPEATVQSHAGKLVIGSMKGKTIIVLRGRFHLYEGYSPEQITFPIRVMQELGVKVMILSNASGGLNPRFSDGDIMIITDHLNLTGENPLIGTDEPSWGVRFPDMSEAYSKSLIAVAEKMGRNAGVHLKKGVYAGLKGPSLETPAEVRFLRTIGADAVGFSTVQETIASVHAGMSVLGFSIITNVHDPARPVIANIDEIIAIAEKSGKKLERIIQGVMEEIHDSEPS